MVEEIIRKRKLSSFTMTGYENQLRQCFREYKKERQTKAPASEEQSHSLESQIRK